MPRVTRFSSMKCSVIVLMLSVLPGLAMANSSMEESSSLPPVEYSYRTDLQNALLAHYSNWAGTRHKLGGTTTRGVDCSSFIQILFQDKFKFELPRSSREQMTVGERVDMTDLRTGDLLFFRTGPTRRHVGVYMGDNRFMHVSTVAGVEIAKLFSPYWQRHFITARRVALGALTPSN